MFKKCSDCGEPLTIDDEACPKCGSRKRTHTIELIETVSLADSNLRLRQRSGETDQRGKPVREVDSKVKGNTESRIRKDRSKRLGGVPETDVYHEVLENGKTIHGPHLEPKSRKRNCKQIN